MSAIPFAPFRVHMAVRATDPGAGLPGRLREAVWRAEPDLPVPVVRSMDEWAALATARYRFDSVLFTTFGAVALLVVALLSSWLPARRAAATDPMETLRVE